MTRDRLDRPLERWQRSQNPHTLLKLVKERAGEGKRKYRLLAAAFCRRVWCKFDAQQRHAVEVVERYADGAAKYNEMRLAVADMRIEGHRTQPLLVEATRRKAADAADGVLFRLLGAWWGTSEQNIDEADREVLRSAWFDERESKAECARTCQIIRESFAHLFDPVAIHPSWRTSTAVELAEAAYRHRDPADGTLESVRLAVLADALQDAGCDSTPLLDHLRDPGPHVRGCWALDLVLDKPE